LPANEVSQHTPEGPNFIFLLERVDVGLFGFFLVPNAFSSSSQCVLIKVLNGFPMVPHPPHPPPPQVPNSTSLHPISFALKFHTCALERGGTPSHLHMPMVIKLCISSLKILNKVLKERLGWDDKKKHHLSM